MRLELLINSSPGERKGWAVRHQAREANRKRVSWTRMAVSSQSHTPPFQIINYSKNFEKLNFLSLTKFI